MNQAQIAASGYIHETLYKYCRGVDRGDAVLIAEAFHHDAIVHQGPITGEIEQLIPHFLARYDEPGCAGQHNITNILISFESQRANVESYFIAARISNRESEVASMTIGGGRYNDVFELRAAGWKIAQRTVIIDWLTQPFNYSRSEARSDYPHGGRRGSDLSFNHFTSFALGGTGV
ncbi:MAG: nuclear transport factor 2 family protein [Parasphingopyxis sp.]|uniref:nuclear transport factor 2 family protein n=1 Tax=Parasphingopyxis sp. TaxID=1920299 RepID=UPI0032EED699